MSNTAGTSFISPRIGAGLKRWALAIGMSVAALAATAASAAPVVVGSVNPSTKRLTVFEDLLVRSFADGAPIERFYGGYSTGSKAYFLTRAGKRAGGGCRTEVFRLVRIAGNRVAIADPGKPSIAWNPQILSNMYATFDCTSTDCMNCLSGDASDPLGADMSNPGCACEVVGGAFNGVCDTAMPGTGGPYGPGAIVVAAP